MFDNPLTKKRQAKLVSVGVRFFVGGSSKFWGGGFHYFGRQVRVSEEVASIN